MVIISSQVAFFCNLTAFVFNLNGVEWLKSFGKCYLGHLKPNLSYLESIGIQSTLICDVTK